MSLAFLTKSAWRHWHLSQNYPRKNFGVDGCPWHSSQNDPESLTFISNPPEGFFVTDVIGIPHKISLTSLTFITKPPWKEFLRWRMPLAFLTKSVWCHWHESQNGRRMIFCDGCHWHSSQNHPRKNFLTDVIGIQNLFSFTSMELTGTNLRRASLGLITKSILETTPPSAPVRDPVNGAQYMSQVRWRALTSVTKSILQQSDPWTFCWR